MRLTVGIRNHISRSAIAAAFDERDKEMKKKEAALALKVYEQVIPPAERLAVEQLHWRWFTITPTLCLNVAGCTIRLRCDHDLRIPHTEYTTNQWSSYFAIIQAGPLADEIMTFSNLKEDFKKERKAAENAIDALLNSVTTLKALMKAWPEGEPYWSEYLNKPTAPSLPALQVSEVNRMLGLPKPEAKGGQADA